MSLDVANVPQEALLASCTPINNVQEDDAGNTKTSENAGDDTTDKDSLHHVLLPPFRYRYYMNFYEIRFANSLGIHAS